jgi:formylglycine-generating enzyme required for sulfatase activity
MNPSRWVTRRIAAILAALCLISAPARLPGDEPAQTFTNSIGMKFVRIAPGEFLMGGELDAAEVVRRFGGQAAW